MQCRYTPMLYNILYPLSDQFKLFNLFKYLTFRSGGAILTSIIISFIVAPVTIRILKKLQKNGQPIREDGPESHLLTKQGTPTMGGILILISLIISTLLWADLTNHYVWIVLFVTCGFGAIGFWDDYLKIVKNHSDGLSGKVKLLFQFLIAGGASFWIQQISPETVSSHLTIPFFKDMLFDLGFLYIAFASVVMVGSSNAVNLTDGLDGLAIVPIMINAACFGLIAYIAGHAVFSGYLHLHSIPGSGEIAIFCAALVGAGLGFLWYNAPPAMVFMGDIGSLAAGGALGVISVITKHEIVLAIIGGLFVLEAVSVIMQVASFKLTGKRIFKMAPIHHHFEKKGWAEATIVIRFWIISFILALIGLSTLKLR